MRVGSMIYGHTCAHNLQPLHYGLSLLNMKYVKTHTHALVTPLPVFVLFFNAVFILLSLHIQQHTVHHSQLPPSFDCLPPYFPSLSATSDCAVVQVSIKFISMCPFECSELNPLKPPHFNQTDRRAYLRKKCGQQLVDGDKRALG